MVLTTDSEFHSFERQMRRLEEDGLAAVERVPTEPFAGFAERFAEKAAAGGHDLIYFSQVFYNSGYAVPGLERIVAAVPDDDCLVVVDGYHGFLARPTDLAAIEGRAFYLWPAATSTPWPAKASASSTRRPARRPGRATPAGSPPSKP